MTKNFNRISLPAKSVKMATTVPSAWLLDA
jgi:hypothetical protein